jgi:hypothetical protein
MENQPKKGPLAAQIRRKIGFIVAVPGGFLTLNFPLNQNVFQGLQRQIEKLKLG